MKKHHLSLAVTLLCSGFLISERCLATDYSWTGDGSFSGDLNVGGNIRVGMAAFATGGASLAVGGDTVASGWASTAIGMGEASGSYSFTMGSGSVAQGNASAALIYSQATGDYSFAAGRYAAAFGVSSLALGPGTTADAFSSVSLGSYNQEMLSANTTTWVATDPLLIVGNGTGDNTHSPFLETHNALVMLKNGKLSLYGTSASTPPIVLDPDTLSIKINGKDVLTAGTGNYYFGDTEAIFASNWKGAGAFGNSGYDKVVLGALVSGFSGATIGAHGSALNGWANLNVAGQSLIFRTNGETEAARITSTGNVGIGTANPASLLTLKAPSVVASTSQINALEITANGTNSTNTGGKLGIIFNHNPNGTAAENSRQAAIYSVSELANSNAVGLAFHTQPQAQSLQERLRIDSAGNVGIGTSSPKDKLDISYGGLRFSADNGAVNSKIQSIKFVRSNYDPTGVAASIDFWRTWGTSEGLLSFSTNSGVALGQSPTERMRIDNNGNVGIGTTSPQAKLDISGDLKVSGAVKLAKQGDIPMGEFGLNGD